MLLPILIHKDKLSKNIEPETSQILKSFSRICITALIIKITISSIVIGFKNSYFPLIHLPSCYQTVQQTNQIQSCSLNQPITFKVVV